jgi:hypothetical protein
MLALAVALARLARAVKPISPIGSAQNQKKLGLTAHGDVYLSSRQLRAEPQRLRLSAAHFCELALNADLGWPVVLYLGLAALLGLCGLLVHVQLHGVVFAIIIYNLVHFNL